MKLKKMFGKSIELHTHGFTDEECEKFIFKPRIYWNGSSTAECEPENWLVDGCKFRIVYEKIK